MLDIQLIVAIFSSFFCLNTYAWKALFEKSYKKLEELDFVFGSLYKEKSYFRVENSNYVRKNW